MHILEHGNRLEDVWSKNTKIQVWICKIQASYCNSLLRSQEYVTFGICQMLRPIWRIFPKVCGTLRHLLFTISSVTVGFAFWVAVITLYIVKSFSMFHCSTQQELKTYESKQFLALLCSQVSWSQLCSKCRLKLVQKHKSWGLGLVLNFSSLCCLR